MAFKYAAFTVMLPEYTIEEAAAVLNKLGYNGVEWRVHNVAACAAGNDYWRGNKATIDLATILEQAPRVKQIADDNGLESIGLGTYIGYKHLDDLKRCMEAAKIIGSPSVRVATPKYDGTQDYNDIIEEVITGFGKVEQLARDFDVQATIELHEQNICCSASLAYRLLSNFDPDYVGVIFDPGNMVCQGYEGWQIALDLLGPYLSHVHVKNAARVEDGVIDGAKQWKTTDTPLKDGFVNWSEVLPILDKVGFKGWLVLEDFGPGDGETKLKDGMEYLKSIEAKFGL